MAPPDAPPQRPYSDAETARGLRLGIAEGTFAFATSTLTSGAILAPLVLSFGLGEAMFGLLAAMPFLAQLLQYPNVIVLRRYSDRRALTIVFATLARCSLFAVAAALLLLPGELVPAAILTGFACWSAFGALSAGAWLWWMRDLVPKNSYGSYFGNRAAVLLACSAPVLLGAGWYLDVSGAAASVAAARTAFAVLFGLAGLSGLVSCALLTRVPHHASGNDPRAIPLRESMRVPFTDRNYRRSLAWLALWGFGSTMSVPFFAVFLLVDAGFSISAVTALLVVGIATNVLFFRLWGPLSDAYGNRPVLAVCVPVLAGALVIASLLPHAPTALVTALAVVVQVLIAVATAGADLTAWNLAYKLSQGPATASYLAGQSVVRAIAWGTGAIVGGAVAALVGDFQIYVEVGPAPLHIAHIQFLFLLGAAAVLLSGIPLARVAEEGQSTRNELVLALRRAAASDTIIPGVRHFAMASSLAVDYIVRAEERARAGIAAGRLSVREAAGGKPRSTRRDPPGGGRG